LSGRNIGGGEDTGGRSGAGFFSIRHEELRSYSIIGRSSLILVGYLLAPFDLGKDDRPKPFISVLSQARITGVAFFPPDVNNRSWGKGNIGFEIYAPLTVIMRPAFTR
jgi:hypothetical protein